MASCDITVEVKIGPALRASCDVLDLAREMIELVPEWHATEREELEARIAALMEIVTDNLRTQ